MKVMTPGSPTGWAHLSAIGRRRLNRQAEQATVKTDKRPNQTSGSGDGRNGQAAKSDKRSKRRADWPDREGGGGPQLGWKKIREEAGPKIRKKEFLN
jgi:hypothetical protein